jgi:hypothetical protein
MRWLTGEWSEDIRISSAIDEKWWEKLSPENPWKRPGIYRLIAFASKTSEPEPLQRICGVDETGTLYIGASKELGNRLSALVTTHHPDYKGQPHQALPQQLARRFPPNQLGFVWQYTETPWHREAELLTSYENAFGELPPLNGQKSGASLPELGLRGA